MSSTPLLLQSQLLLGVPGIVHGFSTRQGGQSQGPFAGLNLSGRVGDERTAVEANRQAALRAIDRPSSLLVALKQVHGNDLVEVTHRAGRTIEADAMVTRDRAAVLAVLTADCIPVLMASPDGRWVAAVHAGWRGTRSKIVLRAVARFAELGCPADTLRVALGPAIGPCCFVVGDDTALALRQAYPSTRAILKDSQERLVADLWQLNVEALLEVGVRAEHIEVLRRCTCCEHEFFFSYRRDKGTTGRQAGLIAAR